jgi:hypothetical protein
VQHRVVLALLAAVWLCGMGRPTGVGRAWAAARQGSRRQAVTEQGAVQNGARRAPVPTTSSWLLVPTGGVALGDGASPGGVVPAPTDRWRRSAITSFC